MFPLKDYKEINQHKLCVEKDTNESMSKISGYRIVDINYLLQWCMNLQYKKLRAVFLYTIYGALELLVIKRDQLIDNETNNRAELFMSILARFNMGKRLNLIQRGSFQRRSVLAGLIYNEGPSWHQNAWKKAVKRSPGNVLKNICAHSNKK